MTSLTIAVWVLAIEGFASIILLLAFLFGMKHELENTLKDTQSLLKTLEQKVSLLSNELDNTLKNTTEVTDSFKDTLKKTGNAIGIAGNLLPLFPLVSMQKSNNKERSFYGTLITVSEFVIAGIEGFKIFNAIFLKGGNKNGRRSRQ